MGLKETIYAHSPIWAQNLMISAYGRKLYNRRYGTLYREERARLAKRDISDGTRLKEIQNERFLAFLHFAVGHSPFYRRFYKDVNLSCVRSVDDIAMLPILDKETLRQNLNEVYTITPAEGYIGKTGGTTGKSLIVRSTKHDSQLRMAYLDWFKSLYGFDQMMNTSARFNGKDIVPLGQAAKIFWRDNRKLKQRIYSSFYTSQDNIPYYVENLNDYKPEELDGFVTSLYDVARYMDEHDIKPAFTPKAIFPTSETVLQHHRDVLTRVFGCPVADQYASSEGAPFIIQTPDDGLMHECIDTGVFEHIKTKHGTKLIVTSFTTHGTPLIRYDIGDNIIEYKEDEMPLSANGFPVIKAIDGRKADALFSPERGHISIANLSNVVKNLPNAVVNIQFIQESSDHIHIKVVVDRSLYDQRKHEKEIFSEMVARFGEHMQFTIEYVDKIERTVGGKYRMIINKL